MKTLQVRELNHKLENTIGYIRVSSISQKDNSSLANQSQKINDYCSLNDISQVDILSEVDSGGNDDRQVLTSIKNLVQSGGVDTLLIYKVDRLGRSMLGSLQFIELCKQNDVRVISISDNIDTSSDQSSLLLNILLSLATEERRQILVRCSNGRDMKWKQNKLPYSKIPFSYRRDKIGNVIVDETSKHIVQYIFKKWNLLSKMKHITTNKRMRRMLKLLETRGYSYYGKKFERWNIRDILKQPLYCGIIRWKGEQKQSEYPSIISKRMFNQIQTTI
jgi:site-specific DNA recombinase